MSRSPPRMISVSLGVYCRLSFMVQVYVSHTCIPSTTKSNATQPRAALRETTAKRSPLDAGTAMLLGCYIEFWAVEPQPPTLMQALRLTRSHIYRLFQQLGSLQGCATPNNGWAYIHIYFRTEKKGKHMGIYVASEYLTHNMYIGVYIYIYTYKCTYINTYTYNM